MTRLILRRLALIVPTLLLVSVLIFVLAEVLPGNVGRTILGPYATQEQVDALNEELGTDQPVVVRYGKWLGGVLTGDWGESFLYQQPVLPLVLERLGNSLLLAGVALVIIIPISVASGILAGLHRDSLLDRTITIASLTLTVIPEFVSGVILLVVFAVMLQWFPVQAVAPPDASIWTRIYYLILPAIPLMLLELGYIGRMARMGTAEVLDQPYIRTAVLKGVPRGRMVRKHVLRNAMVPTVTVIGAQIGWLVGGLVVVEQLFSYPGIGKLMVDSAIGHDIFVLEASVLCVAAIYMFSNLAADVVVAWLNPQVRGRS